MNGNDRAPKIAVLMPMVWSVRNVVYSGVLQRLGEAGVDMHLLMRERPPEAVMEQSEFASAAGCHELVAPIHRRRVVGRAFVRDVVHSAYNQRNHIASYPIYRRWFGRESTRFQRGRMRVVDLIGALVQPAPVYFALCRLYDSMHYAAYDLEPIRTQLRALAPDLIWSTVNMEKIYEHAYVMAARDLGIPVVTSILSFDNLTSKAVRLTYEHYLVWNKRMHDQLLQFYPQISPEQVTITGTPQFDFHRRPEFHWPRAQTLESLGLPPDARYFLYGTSNRDLAPEEPDLVARVARHMQADPALKDFWLVVRYHPWEVAERWQGVLAASDHVVLQRPWNVDPREDRWAISTPDDQTRFVSTLEYSEACLNIASTISLDAAILDRPAICIRFEHEPDAPRGILYEEYDATHYKPLVESGGLRVANHWPELLALMHEATTEPGRDHDRRARMVETECGPVDGHSADRVVGALVQLVNARRNGK
jgi:hypothetical protein